MSAGRKATIVGVITLALLALGVRAVDVVERQEISRCADLLLDANYGDGSPDAYNMEPCQSLNDWNLGRAIQLFDARLMRRGNGDEMPKE